MLSLKETIRKIKQETLISALRVLLFVLVLLVLGIAFIFWQQWRVQQESPGPPGEQELSNQQKKEILEGLSAPPDAPQYTNEEKEQILRGLSIPSDKPVLSDKEKKRILESLSAP